MSLTTQYLLGIDAPSLDRASSSGTARSNDERPKIILLSQEEVAEIIASHPLIIGRLRSGSAQLRVSVESGVWTVEKNTVEGGEK